MKWRKIISREYSVQYCEVALNAIGKRASHLLDFHMSNFLIIPENKNECFYFEGDEEKEFIFLMVEQFTKDTSKFDSFKKLYKRLADDYVGFCEKVDGIELSNLDNDKLKELFLKYQKKVVDYTCIGIWAGFLLNDYWTEQGNRILKTEDDKVREALFRPVKKSTILIMQEKAAEIKGNKDEIKKFWEEYRWLPCLDLQNEPWSLKDVEDYINDIKIGEPEERLGFEDAVRKADLSEEEIEKFRMIKELGHIKDARDDYRRKGIFNIQELFKEIAKRMSISLKEIAYLTEDEIIGFLEGKQIDLNKGKKRQEGFMMYTKDDKLVCVDHAIQQELEKIGFVGEEEEINEVRGTVAFKGKAKGIVKIVRTVHDILKVEKGDVLVAVTTHPDYVTAMQKAAAIVTDEGGMLSHAAIVSRELKIPCIVGTTNATKALQHGSKVEVTEEGVVKILSC